MLIVLCLRYSYLATAQAARFTYRAKETIKEQEVEFPHGYTLHLADDKHWRYAPDVLKRYAGEMTTP